MSFILPQSSTLYAVLRQGHTILAYLLLAAFFAHFGAILFHTLVVRDGLLLRMVPWNIGPPRSSPPQNEEPVTLPKESS